MPNFTLSDIRKSAESKYGDLTIDLEDGETPVVLVNALRLPKDKRKALVALQEDKPEGEQELDQADELASAIRLVAKNEYQADRLLSAIDGDLTQLVTIFREYTESTQAGEA